MNPAYNSNLSSSSFHFLDLNEDHMPEYEQYGSMITTHPELSRHTPASSTCPAFFNSARDCQTGSQLGDYPQTSQKVKIYNK